MDKMHRDRIAFLRITSGQYQRGMRMRQVRLGRDVQVANAFTFVVLLYKVRRDSMRSAAIWSVLSGIGATCALAPAWYFRDLTYNWALAFPAIAVYVGVMFAIRLLSPADFGRVTAAIKARRGG